MAVEKIGICGAGKMGSGIAVTAALAGYPVILEDISDDSLEKAMLHIRDQLDKMSVKGKVAKADADTAFNLISCTSRYEGYEDVDFVIEVVAENLDIKNSVFKKLDEICKGSVVLTSSTSTYSITSIAAATKRPESVCGMHFFLPPSKLIEITKGYYTSPASMAVCREVAERMGKLCVDVKKDSPGFIANRIYTPLFIEAFKAHEEGLASIEDIDKAMTTTYLPIGPFALADIIGLDVILSGLEYYEKEIGQQWKAPRSLKELVKAGRLGKKTGKGWYDYT